MISALQEHARKPPLPVDAPMVEMTCNYLEACHLIFEKGILNRLFHPNINEFLKTSLKASASLKIGPHVTRILVRELQHNNNKF